MAVRAHWAPDRRDMIWIDCNPHAEPEPLKGIPGREMKDIHPLAVLSPRSFNERTGIVIGLPMTTASFNEMNPFAVRLAGPGKQMSYILTHRPKSFDWRARNAKLHPWKRIPEDVFASACIALNQIIAIG